MTKTTRRADKAIHLLDELIEQLHYFYNGDEERFKKEVLKSALEIENTLKDLSVNQKETFKRISKRYEKYYRERNEAIENTISNVDSEQLIDSIRDKYKDNLKED